MLNQIRDEQDSVMINASTGELVTTYFDSINAYALNELVINSGVLPVTEFSLTIASDTILTEDVVMRTRVGSAIESEVEISAPSIAWDSDSWGLDIASSAYMISDNFSKFNSGAEIESRSMLFFGDTQGGAAACVINVETDMLPSSGVKMEVGTAIENSAYIANLNRDPIEICVYMDTDTEMYVRDVISFNASDAASRASLLPPYTIRKWNNPDFEPTVAISSGGLINPVIYKHSTDIAGAPAIYTDAEVIGRWLFTQSHVDVDADITRRRYVDTTSTVITEMTSDGEVIGRWWWADNTTSMDGGIAGNIVNSPVTSTNTAAVKTSGAVIGKMATRYVKDVEMKGSALIYVDGGIKISEHKNCPVFI